jgi:uncharacterized membrane protein YedE/YeeE
MIESTLVFLSLIAIGVFCGVALGALIVFIIGILASIALLFFPKGNNHV